MLCESVIVYAGSGARTRSNGRKKRYLTPLNGPERTRSCLSRLPSWATVNRGGRVALARWSRGFHPFAMIIAGIFRSDRTRDFLSLRAVLLVSSNSNHRTRLFSFLIRSYEPAEMTVTGATTARVGQGYVPPFKYVSSFGPAPQVTGTVTGTATSELVLTHINAC